MAVAMVGLVKTMRPILDLDRDEMGAMVEVALLESVTML